MTPKEKIIRKLIKQNKLCTHYFLHFGNNSKGFNQKINTIKLNISKGFKYEVSRIKL